MQHPKRIETVHAETLEGELCLYDWQRLEVHNLNPTAARVWELCDGQTTPQEMAAQLHGDLTPAQAEELVWLALKRLEKANLLDERNKVVQPAGPQREVYSRREMLTKLGVAAIMLPVVSTIVAPSPVEAQSPAPGPAPSITVCSHNNRGPYTDSIPAGSYDPLYNSPNDFPGGGFPSIGFCPPDLVAGLQVTFTATSFGDGSITINNSPHTFDLDANGEATYSNLEVSISGTAGQSVTFDVAARLVGHDEVPTPLFGPYTYSFT